MPTTSVSAVRMHSLRSSTNEDLAVADLLGSGLGGGGGLNALVVDRDPGHPGLCSDRIETDAPDNPL